MIHVMAVHAMSHAISPESYCDGLPELVRFPLLPLPAGYRVLSSMFSDDVAISWVAGVVSDIIEISAEIFSGGTVKNW